MSSPREGGIEVMGRAGRYNDEISHTRPRADTRPDPTVPRCTPQSPQVAFRPQQVVKARARPRAVVCGAPREDLETARMKTRVITLLLAAGLLAVAALTALSLPAAAQTQTVYVQLPTARSCPSPSTSRPAPSLDDIQLPGTPVPAPPAPETTVPAPLRRPARASEARSQPEPARWRRQAAAAATGRAPTAAPRRSAPDSGRRVQQKDSDGARAGRRGRGSSQG